MPVHDIRRLGKAVFDPRNVFQHFASRMRVRQMHMHLTHVACVRCDGQAKRIGGVANAQYFSQARHTRDVRRNPGDGLLGKEFGKRICGVKLLAQRDWNGCDTRKLGVAFNVIVPKWFFKPVDVKRLCRAAKALAGRQIPFAVAVNCQRHVGPNGMAYGSQALQVALDS